MKYSKENDSRRNVKIVLSKIPKEDFLKSVKSPPERVTKLSTYNIEYYRASVYVAGRYLKFSRELSQSPWVIEGERKGSTSVQELICNHIMTNFKAADSKFITSGREDVDVRMLGRGRPFAVELINCKQIVKDSDKYYQIQQHINNNSNKQVALIDLQFISKIDMSKLKEGEEKKRKQYRCVVWVSKSITEKDLDLLRGMKPIIINQTTPVRVLHRRALMVRKKTIFKIDGKIINEHYLIVDLETQAGTYIKEFIHGDLGRTTPNFGVFFASLIASLFVMFFSECFFCDELLLLFLSLSSFFFYRSFWGFFFSPSWGVVLPPAPPSSYLVPAGRFF